MKPLLIAGLGNTLLGDDGVGPAVIAKLLALSGSWPEADIEDLGTPGLELAGYLAHRRTVILIDSMRGNEPAGSIRIFERDEILAQSAPLRAESHSASLIESLRTLEFAEAAPLSVTLVGIAGENYEFGASLSPAVQAAVEPAVRVIEGLLKDL